VSAAIDELNASGELAKIEQKWMSEAAGAPKLD
jgi:ABC-type amino acid transport substrate-binding protein